MLNLCYGLRLPFLAIGLVLFFVVERYFSSEDFATTLRAGALLLALLGPALTLWASQICRGRQLVGEAQSLIMSAVWQLLVVVGLGVYLLYHKMMGDASTPETFGMKVLLGTWIILLILPTITGMGIEWSHRQSGRGSLGEPFKVRKTAMSWLMAGIALSFVVCINFAGAKRDKAFDWSYLKVTTPGPATRNMVKSLEKKLEVNIFFPTSNEVRPFVTEYFEALAQSEPMVEVHYYDKELNPKIADEMRVSVNGQVVLSQEKRRERIDIGLKISSARSALRKLDSEFQKAFLQISADRKIVYFTRGHGEMTWVGSGDQSQGMKTLRKLEGALRSLNYSVRQFALSDGSGVNLPDDVSLVVIAGPTEPFLAGEIDILRGYLDRGGRLLVLFDLPEKGEGTPILQDPSGERPLYEFMKSVGIDYVGKPLANDKIHVDSRRGKVDRMFLITNSFTSHESVTSLAQHDDRVAVAYRNSGYLKVATQSGAWRAQETIRANARTFVDENGNYEFDSGKEKRQAYAVGAISEKEIAGAEGDEAKKAQIIAFADASMISDFLFQNLGNRVLIGDSFNYLIGRSEAVGEIASEEDIKIRHTKNEQVAWFYGTVTTVPLLLLAAGFVATRRRKRTRGE